MTTPLVSIVMPAYGHRTYILRTLDSVFRQTFKDYEIIVVNDGSPDDTATLLKPLARAGRITYLEQANQGQPTARNRGLAQARGRFIALLDDDDLWPEDKLEWQVNFLEQNPTVGVIAGVAQMIDEHERPGGRQDCHPSITFESLFNHNPIHTPGQTLIRADLLRSLGGFNPAIWGADDWDLWFRIIRRQEIVMQDRLALYYRMHPTNASKQVGRLLEGCCMVIKGHLKHAAPGRRWGLRRAGYRQIYGTFGSALVDVARHEVKEGRLGGAWRELVPLRAMGAGFFLDPAFCAWFLRDLLITPVWHRLRRARVALFKTREVKRRRA